MKSQKIKMLWTFDDYAKHLSHENRLVRAWSLTAIATRYENRYSDAVAALVHDEDDELAIMAMNYLAAHKAIAHAPEILDRMVETENNDLAAAGLRALTALRYEKAADVVYEGITRPGDVLGAVKYIETLIEYSGEVRTEHGRLWLRKAISSMTAEDCHLESIGALLRHRRVEDIEMVMDQLIASGNDIDGNENLIEWMLKPAGADAYYVAFNKHAKSRGFFEFNVRECLDDVSLLAIYEETTAAIASSLENGGHAAFLAVLKAEIEKMAEGRYPAGDDMPEPLRELKAADQMCRDLIDCLEKRPDIWPAMGLESENAFRDFMLPMLLALFCAVTERGFYAMALRPDAGDGEGTETEAKRIEDLFFQAGPGLPEPLFEKMVEALPPSLLILETPSLPESWTYYWGIKIMRRRGSKRYAAPLMNILDARDPDEERIILKAFNPSREIIHAIRALDESADSVILALLEKAILVPRESFEILEYLPYAEAHDMAEAIWEDDPEMANRELFARCLCGIGDARAIPKLSELYDKETEPLYIINAIELLSALHGVAAPGFEEMARRRDEIIEERSLRSRQAAMKRLLALEKDASKPRFAKATVRRQRPKIGRNEPCPCGSGKKFKKCCLDRF